MNPSGGRGGTDFPSFGGQGGRSGSGRGRWSLERIVFGRQGGVGIGGLIHKSFASTSDRLCQRVFSRLLGVWLAGGSGRSLSRGGGRAF